MPWKIVVDGILIFFPEKVLVMHDISCDLSGLIFSEKKKEFKLSSTAVLMVF